MTYGERREALEKWLSLEEGPERVAFVEGLLSGLGHPVIGLDHLAAVIAVGCLAATQPKGMVS